MLNVSIIGASGYTGAELIHLLLRHPQMQLCHTLVSENSEDAGKPVSQLYGSLAHCDKVILEPATPSRLEKLANTMDFIFLATPHQFSHDCMPLISGRKAIILDLSGAFRLKNTDTFTRYYGFSHTAGRELDKAVYGLAEWYGKDIRSAQIVAVPGCYPTASLTALKPLHEAQLLDDAVRPVINAVSGVSGAGRKAALNTSFYEVSLQAYGVLGHRHQPEIESWLGRPVIFTPHLGNFKRGILATVTVKTRPGVSADELNTAYINAYQNKPLVRLRDTFPKLDDVVHTPYVDVHWKLDPESGYAVITAAIDNLLKGAASQAVQCANLIASLSESAGLGAE